MLMNQTLSPKKQTLINEGKKRIFQKTFYPFQDYGTSIYDLLADPVKKTLGHLIIFILILLVLRYIKILKFLMRLDHPEIYIVLLILYAYHVFINQLHLNDNIEFLSKKLPDNATIYDYEQFLTPKSNTISNLVITTIGILISEFILFSITYPSWFKSISSDVYLQNLSHRK